MDEGLCLMESDKATFGLRLSGRRASHQAERRKIPWKLEQSFARLMLMPKRVQTGKTCQQKGIGCMSKKPVMLKRVAKSKKHGRNPRMHCPTVGDLTRGYPGLRAKGKWGFCGNCDDFIAEVIRIRPPLNCLLEASGIFKGRWLLKENPGQLAVLICQN